ncbi:MAG: hypothetical protein HC922_06635 [Leptolyngbyaceae cyanobacterium SM2_3_12]|nr:hypothetical protein [Leptolyngbyaceae cyanobacterium SM2_3_12]
MLAYPSLTDRTASLEAIVRQALLFEELTLQAEATVQCISQQPDLTSDEMRILEILQDAMAQGYVRRG